MKVAALVSSLFVLAQSASAHYAFKVLLSGDKTSANAVRQPSTIDPFHGIDSAAATCNVNIGKATEVMTVAPGGKLGFQLSNAMYHEGPVAIYLGQAPGKVSDWDGSGQSWFKIDEWGAESYNPTVFKSHNLNEFFTTVPENTPPGEYLARIEQIALHLGTGVPEIFVSCAQIKVTGNGTGNPPKVSIPGYIKADDPGVTANIYTGMTSYTVPGPKVWRG